MVNRVSRFLYPVIVLSIIVVVNLISYSYYFRLDFTEDKRETLSERNREFIKSVDQNVDITGYFLDNSDDRQNAIDILDRLVYQNKKISYSVIDPDKQPSKAKRDGISKYGVLVVKSEIGKKEEVGRLSENSLVDAISRVISEKSKKIYFLTGHGERSIDDLDNSGFAEVSKFLVNSGYEVGKLDLISSSKIPDDATLIFIAGPVRDLFKKEEDLISSWLNSGGSLMLTIDPGYSAKSYTGILSHYGITVLDDLIVDPVAKDLQLEPLVAVASGYADTAMMKNINIATLYPLARSIKVEKRQGIDNYILAQSSDQSWGETDQLSIESGKASFNPADDGKGPRGIIASAEEDFDIPVEERKIDDVAKRKRIIVVGDSDFVSNSGIDYVGNSDLLLNIVSWLTGDNRIYFGSKSPQFDPLVFTSSDISVLASIVLIFSPALVIVAGLFVYRRRKKS